MGLLTEKARQQLPPLHSADRDSVHSATVQVKFFAPDSHQTFYAIEFDGEDTFFGLVSDLEVTVGYFSLSELQAARGPLGWPIERDIQFAPRPLTQIPEYRRWAGRETK